MAPVTDTSEPRVRRPASPFADVRPAVALAVLYGAAVVVWLVGGRGLPGNRWFAIHLFTLGVLSNAVLAFTRHFAETMLHRPSPDHPHARLAVLNVGALAVLVGLPSGQRLLVGLGAMLACAAVFSLYRVLRRLRRTSLPSRFTFVVRTYERACGAFLHGAVLGALLGTTVIPASWSGGARLAHLHANVLGWGGLTLLATLVVFGPTILRTRMRPRADATAARWLRYGATGLTVAVLALVVSAPPAPLWLIWRTVAAAGLVVYAVAASAVCMSVLSAARTARASAPGFSITAACVWFPGVAWADAVAVATGRWWLLDALGVVVLAGVLGQAVLASMGYLAPLLRTSGDLRDVVRRRVSAGALPRVVLLNAGVAAVAAAVAGVAPPAARIGWAAVVTAVLVQGALTAWPVRRRAD
ncbi:MAG: hypothetical protein GEU74_06235 [Nitriliruptorales bacterium]|nr:hypothetical protein [Nitriliruptorales bacterium]